MTVNVASLTATVGGVDLAPSGGGVSFDTTRAPHVSCSLNVPFRADTLPALDPRQSPPPRIQIKSSGRAFDLTVRGRTVNHDTGDVVLSLASDEALLSDYAPLVDDEKPYAYQSSLRGVVNYVLGKALPGAALQASPSVDANATVYTSAVNLARDPRVTDVSNYGPVNCTRIADGTFPGAQSGVSHAGVHLHTPTSADSFVEVYLSSSLAAGKTYTVSATGSVRAAVGGSATSRSRRIVVFYQVGAGPYLEAASPAVPATVRTGTAGTRVSVTVTLPPGTTSALVRLYHGHTSGTISWALPRVSEWVAPGPHNVDYFCGALPPTAQYAFAFDGTADASASRRTLVIDAPAPDALWWRAGVDAMRFLAPILQARGLRLVCDERRRWTLRGESYEAPGALALRAGVNIVSAGEVISRDERFWFDARVTRYRWTDQGGVQQERLDAYAINTPYTRLTTLDIAAPYPGPGRSEYAVRVAQSVGREVVATLQAVWTATAEQVVSVVLDGAPTQIGVARAVEFDFTSGEMTITTRTTDTPAGAVNLLTGTVNNLTGTVNNL